MNTWADGTPRSQGNAFDWGNRPGSIATSKAWKHSEASKRAVQKTPGRAFTIYSRAKPSK